MKKICYFIVFTIFLFIAVSKAEATTGTMGSIGANTPISLGLSTGNAYCGSLRVSTTNLTTGQTMTVTATTNANFPNIGASAFELFNTDNANKHIKFTSATDTKVLGAIKYFGGNITSSVLTVKFSDLDHQDKNWGTGTKKPENIKIIAYFNRSSTSGGFWSKETSVCTKTFKVVQPAPTTNKCSCTAAFGTCDDFPGHPNSQRRTCTSLATGAYTCEKVGTVYYNYRVCPTSMCACDATNYCTSQCSFNTYKGISGITYPTPFAVKCQVTTPANIYQPTPAPAQKNDWCNRPNRTKGDATSDDKVSIADYFYWAQAFYGHKIPASINPDFNGDGVINNTDRNIIIHRLNTGL